MRDSAILGYLLRSSWALKPDVLETLVQIVVRHAAGEKADDQILAAARQSREDKAAQAEGAGRSRSYQVRDGVAVIPIWGVIDKRAEDVEDISGPFGTATETVSAQLREALEDSEVSGILLDVDSPGGTVSGVDALADEIYRARSEKQIVTYAGDLMASAAFWLGAQSSRVVVGKAAAVGSIGVYSVVSDTSRLMRNRGVDVTLVRAGEFKGLGTMGVPVEEKGLAQLQKEVNTYYDLFLSAVSQGRAMDLEAVRGIADGSVAIGQEAVDKGMADALAAFEEVIAWMAPRNPEARISAGSEPDRPMKPAPT